MTKRPNTFAAKMQAAIDALNAAECASDEATARALRLEAHAINSAAAREAEAA